MFLKKKSKAQDVLWNFPCERLQCAAYENTQEKHLLGESPHFYHMLPMEMRVRKDEDFLWTIMNIKDEYDTNVEAPVPTAAVVALESELAVASTNTTTPTLLIIVIGQDDERDKDAVL